MSDHRIGCVILAAGAGTRYGEPKAGALLETGERFVDRVVATARDGGIVDIVAVMHPNIPPPEGVRSIVNTRPTSEQIVSLRMGLAQLVNVPVRGTLVWPVDHPYVLATTIASVVNMARMRSPLIARPSYNGKHGHPVYFSRDIWSELVTAAHGGAREVVHRNASHVLDLLVQDAGVIRDMDVKF